MRKFLVTLSCVVAMSAPLTALAATVDATLIPDGTYVVKVEKVDDPQHITVMMPNGIETTLSAKPSLSFSNLKPNVSVKLSMSKGTVLVFAQQ